VVYARQEVFLGEDGGSVLLLLLAGLAGLGVVGSAGHFMA
jgi:hypothetical protein